jgi:hypothetical protein
MFEIRRGRQNGLVINPTTGSAAPDAGRNVFLF